MKSVVGTCCEEGCVRRNIWRKKMWGRPPAFILLLTICKPTMAQKKTTLCKNINNMRMMSKTKCQGLVRGKRDIESKKIRLGISTATIQQVWVHSPHWTSNPVRDKSVLWIAETLRQTKGAPSLTTKCKLQRAPPPLHATIGHPRRKGKTSCFHFFITR